MMKRRVINMETGEEIDDESPEKVLTPKLGVKRVGQAKPVVAPPGADPGLRPEPELESELKLDPDPDPGPALVEEVTVETPWPLPGRVQIVCLRPSRRNEVGRVTGNKYVFENGEPVLVDVRDAGYMKSTRRGSRNRTEGETRVFVELADL